MRIEDVKIIRREYAHHTYCGYFHISRTKLTKFLATPTVCPLVIYGISKFLNFNREYPGKLEKSSILYVVYAKA
jgi:hypothetical protein